MAKTFYVAAYWLLNVSINCVQEQTYLRIHPILTGLSYVEVTYRVIRQLKTRTENLGKYTIIKEEQSETKKRKREEKGKKTKRQKRRYISPTGFIFG